MHSVVPCQAGLAGFLLAPFSHTRTHTYPLFSTQHQPQKKNAGGIEGLTRSLAAELAPAVRVNAIAPSLTDTPLASVLTRSAAMK